eukprot:1136666-Pelagomonas_calceolata.AAC.1
MPLADDIDPLVLPVQLHDWDLAAAAHAAAVAFERAELMMRCSKGSRKRRMQQELRHQQVCGHVVVVVMVVVHAARAATPASVWACAGGVTCSKSCGTSRCVGMCAGAGAGKEEQRRGDLGMLQSVSVSCLLDRILRRPSPPPDKVSKMFLRRCCMRCCIRCTRKAKRVSPCPTAAAPNC